MDSDQGVLRLAAQQVPPQRARARAGEEFLLAGKLTVPDARRGIVPRPRLDTLLDEGLERGVTVVSAPPGFGKTTLVAAWARSRVDEDVAWLTLDEADKDPTRFLRYALAALRRAPSVSYDELERLLPPPPFAHVDDRYLTALTRALADLRHRMVLVLDDFHEVTGSPTERLVARLLRYRPSTLHLVILTRVDPDVGVHRLRLSGELVEVLAADLAFAVDETRALLAGGGVTLAEADVARLQQATEGWAAALRLATVSLTSTVDTSGFVASFAGDDSYVGEYLLNEVLNRQPQRIREFLLRTCVLDRVCGDLADALTGGTDGARVLADLRRANLFIVAVDNGRRWYRWHEMFAELLRSRLHAEHPGLEPTLHARAAAWYEQVGLPVAAARHAAAAQDWDALVRLVTQCWLGLVMRGEATTVRTLLAPLPPELARASAEVCGARAFLAIDDADLTTTSRLSEAAARLAVALPRERRVATQAVAVICALHLATMTGRDLDAAAPRALRLLDEMPEVTPLVDHATRMRRALLLYALGAFETGDLQYDAAAGHLREALTEAVATGLPHVELSCYAQFVSHDFRNGRLDRAAQRATEVIEAAEERGWGGYHNLGGAHVDLAGICLLRHDLGGALQHLAVASEQVRGVDLVNRFHVAFLRGVALRGMGNLVSARDTLRQLHALTTAWQAPEWVAVSVQTANADQLAAEGDVAGALAVLSAPDSTQADASVTRPHGVVRASLLVASGRAREAREVLTAWTREDRGRPVLVAALVVDAVAADMLGAHDEALELTGRALDAAAEDRLLGPLVGYGPAVAPLLRERLELGTAQEALAVEALAHLVPVQRSGERLPYPVEPLSDRELDVLRQLQGTLSNSEIAARLFVSLNTVKSHLKSINRKLGTSGRREAVKRGRDLGIL